MGEHRCNENEKVKLMSIGRLRWMPKSPLFLLKDNTCFVVVADDDKKLADIKR